MRGLEKDHGGGLEGRLQGDLRAHPNIWTQEEILTYFLKKIVKIRPLIAELQLSKSGPHFQKSVICNRSVEIGQNLTQSPNI